MDTESKNWFVVERSEALASLLLTSRNDVSVQRETKRDDGVDLLVALKDGEDLLPTKLFVVQVKGTLSPNKKTWKPLFRAGKYYLPACVFVVNVRENNSAYAWLAEPKVAGHTARLDFFEHPTFHDLDAETLGEIINQVRAWYDALPRELVKEHE